MNNAAEEALYRGWAPATAGLLVMASMLLPDSWRHVLLSASLVFLAWDVVQRRRQSEQILVASARKNAKLKEALDTLPAFVVIVSDDARVRLINSYAAEWLGVPDSRAVGQALQRLGLRLSGEQLIELRHQLRASGRVTNYPVRVDLRDGKVMDVQLNARRIEHDGHPASLFVALDVTQHNRAYELLRQSERRLADLVNCAMDGVISIDNNHRVVVFNEAAAKMFGISAEKAVGMELARFIPMPSRDRHANEVRQVMESERTVVQLMHKKRIVHGLRADGAEFPLEAVISTSGQGSERTATVMVRDLTAFEAAERAQMNAAAQAASVQAKQAFLSRMSHELRTPLTAVLGYAQLLSEGSEDHLTEDDMVQLRCILQAGHQLKALVDDVLVLAQAQTGNVKLCYEKVNVRELFDSVRVITATSADEAGVELVVVRPERCDTLHGDVLRLRQVLLNLVSNGIKYNRRGGYVRLACESCNGDGEVVISVTDNGLGMSEQQLAGLFEPFNRLGRERSEVPGTGLGLMLVRELVDLMGGTVEVSSQLGHGAQFRLCLPKVPSHVLEEPQLAASDEANIGSMQSSPASRIKGSGPWRVLYIEDNRINATLVQRLLKRIDDVEVHIEETGRAGLEAAAQLRPDLVLLDLHLDDIPGTEVLSRLRLMPELTNIPVVVLSASLMHETQEQALLSGATAYWTKPLNLEVFPLQVKALLGLGAANEG